MQPSWCWWPLPRWSSVNIIHNTIEEKKTKQQIQKTKQKNAIQVIILRHYHHLFHCLSRQICHHCDQLCHHLFPNFSICPLTFVIINISIVITITCSNCHRLRPTCEDYWGFWKFKPLSKTMLVKSIWSSDFFWKYVIIIYATMHVGFDGCTYFCWYFWTTKIFSIRNYNNKKLS